MNDAKTVKTRTARIAKFVAMLVRGETVEDSGKAAGVAQEEPKVI